jgi:acetylglutamate kinase
MNDKMKKTEPLILFKYGGNAMVNDDLKKEVLKSICAIADEGYRVVIVHGGGPFIQQALTEAKIESEFIDGQRKTSTEAFEYVEMALKGKVNGSLVRIINSLGHKAVGLSGKDGHTVTASKRIFKRVINQMVEDVDLGQVGDVARVDTSLIDLLLDNGYIPVITCLAADKAGNGYNINADIFAGHIAGALKASQYVVLTDVDGLLRDKDDPTSLMSKLSLSEADGLLEEEVIQGGMIPKIESCGIAIKKGAASARIINGTRPEQIALITENKTTGTIISK